MKQRFTPTRFGTNRERIMVDVGRTLEVIEQVKMARQKLETLDLFGLTDEDAEALIAVAQVLVASALQEQQRGR